MRPAGLLLARVSQRPEATGAEKGVEICGLALLLALFSAGCSSGDQTSALVKSVIDDLATQRFGTATARYRNDEEAILSPAAAPTWRRGLEHEDATVREWSVDALARIGEPEDVARILAALEDPFRRVQEAAARGIVEMDPSAAREAFVERLASDDPLLQMISAQGLADLGDPTGVEPLLAQVRNPAVKEAVRSVIVQSLAVLSDPRAIALLAALAADADASLQLRRNAAEGLATFEQEEATEALRGLLHSDDGYVQEVARRIIAVRR